MAVSPGAGKTELVSGQEPRFCSLALVSVCKVEVVSGLLLAPKEITEMKPSTVPGTW